jgi:hypothetical protein
MADQVHPTADSPPLSTGEPQKLTPFSDPLAPPKHETYIIKIPKDRIFRYPPPENSHRFQKYSKKKQGRRCCRRCLCWTLALLALIVFLVGVTACILYLVYRPEAPKYSVDNLAIRGVNLTATGPISPQITVTVRARNPNDKIGVYHETGGSSKLFYSGVNLCNGVLPAFYQPSNNVTVFQTELRGSDIVLSSQLHTALLTEQRQGRVPLRLNLEAPVKIKVGSVKTWTITFKIKCDLTVDNLTAGSTIVTKDCDYSVKMW